ncbi:forkhead box protein N3 isoform X1 [Conger conger]|uniref:forkhead box protein N3 isoform X1 n=1 Tax=Conger conger TaxID=82655 RepID=UPI002A5A5B3C|nr:forkhead box protein N3 isoform X1 [Conger conger]XP_061110368.1 forkhead box protein N3 isoform X1 [Conger conger]XP_061110376.1 forkhead box protein N3 isoform X1 [Conger conger]XP_061110385.1 forkhead box protein N3 isoform X1 [Conger conger]XP_061110394.1 forkhead box protein N3 isoform X1 [Conger conger]XP_061110402.1 forkhead box protein N3 isoform X1 [Conger conger]XP_061110412.1 forkhead box protein N3 isoform X1 [Conger conger]XP_061110422.1 forkhead box protein N3 isoform X1 [Co
MGPVMPPSKKPEGSGVSVTSGLSQFYQASSLTRALQEEEEEEMDLKPPVIKLEKSGLDDEELTNLNWLHESKNLLNSFGDSMLRSVSPVQELDEDTPPSPAQSDLPYDAKQNPNCKPPYSFSCLIFMAIEDSPSKRLPVKDIYNWILEHFPYFANAPTGWKNSVRHNLSLNKCFKKVDKDRSQSIGKGSLWCIDPEYRQNLIQALKKTPYHPYSQVFTTPPTSPQAYQSLSSPPLWPGSPYFRKNGGVLLQDPEFDAAATMMLLNTPDLPTPFPQGVIQNGARMMGQTMFPGIRPLPINPIGSRTTTVRSAGGGYRMRSDSEQSSDSPLVSSDPKEDHNYSSAKSSSLRGGASPSSPLGEEAPREGSEASFHCIDTNSDTEDDGKIKKEPKDLSLDAVSLAQHKKRQHLTKAKQKVSSDTLPLKKRRTEKPPESDDEEMKEAAGSLLHLAGVRACLNNITNRTAKGQKEQKDSMKN